MCNAYHVSQNSCAILDHSINVYQLASSSKFCTERVRCFFLSFSWLEIVVVRKDTRYWGREKAERERESEWVWKGAQWYAYFSSIHRYFYLSSQSLALFCQSIVCCILCIWFESFFFFVWKNVCSAQTFKLKITQRYHKYTLKPMVPLLFTG